METGIEVN